MNDGARATALLQAGHSLPFLPFMSFAPAPVVPVASDVSTNVASGSYSTVRGAIKAAAAMAGIPNALVIPAFSLLAISASLGEDRRCT
jgi:hypothetical protein